MGEDCAESDDFELSLELSIGGGKYENSLGPKNNNFGRSDLSGDGPVDMQRRREIQARRRQEARKKREEKLEKSRKVGFLENINGDSKKLLFEAQKYQARAEDRGIREKDGILGEKIRKREKIGGGEVAKDELGLTLFTENKNVVVVKRENKECVLYPKVQYLAEPLNYGVQFWGCEGEETVSNRSLEQSSSPVSDYQSKFHKGYAGTRLIGNYRVADVGAINADLNISSSRLRNHMNFSSLGMLSRITEVGHENGRVNELDKPKFENINGDNLFSTFGSWNNDSSYYAENFTCGIKREMDDDNTQFVNTQDVETRNNPHILSRNLSLPKPSSAEIGAMEKLLHFQDTVPCKIRAKRGCATHPRSIAERVRRTRISERMRKLQELVPNMDKQTNTADMLDLAVEYIKGLQKQYKTLSDVRANCKCSASEKYLNQAH